MVTIRNLKKQYGTFPVLRGLFMNIQKGDVYGFLGRNGSGKTTTMSIITNTIPKDSGDVFIGDGEPVRVGYLPESPMLFGYMTAREYLEYIASCCKYSGDVNARVNEVLDIVGLTSAADRRTKGYSRGMAQRLGLGAAIIGEPQLLLLDEPTSALDPQGRADVIEIIKRLNDSGVTIILSTHILPDVERVANRIGIMNNGIIAEEGSISELMNKYSTDRVNLTVRGLTTDTKVRLLSVDFAKADFDESSGRFEFKCDNIEACAGKLMHIMTDHSIIPESFSLGTSSLEELFRKVVGENAT